LAEDDQPAGLEAAFLAHRERLLRFARLRGAGDAAEDVLQDLWLKLSAARTGPVANPLSYLHRSLDRVMIDRYRAARDAERRDRDWTFATGGAAIGVSDQPSAERLLIAQDRMRQVALVLDGLEPPRVAAIFRRHRIDGVPQKDIAAEFGVSLSTVESDLRRAYRALAEWKERVDEV